MKFLYTAKKSDGAEYEGIIEVQNRSAFFNEFKKIGDQLVHVKEVKDKKIFKLNLSLDTIKIVDKISFARNLSSILSAGLPLSRAISACERQTDNQKLKNIYINLNLDISAGKTFSDALSKYSDIFPPVFISMIKVGEENGNLADSLVQVANLLEKDFSIQNKLRTFLLQLKLIISAVVLGGFLKITYAGNNFFDPIIIGVTALFFYFLLKTRALKKMKDLLLLKVPVINILVKEINTTQIARMLSSMLMVGVDILTAVKITGESVDNVYFKEVLEKTEEGIQSGLPLATFFEKNKKLFPVFIGEMMNVGEETGKLSMMLLGVANFYENEIDEKIKEMSSMIGATLIVGVGLICGFLLAR